MRANGYLLLLCVATVAACSQSRESGQAGTENGQLQSGQSAGEAQAARLPDPTSGEGNRALVKILNASGSSFVLYAPVGRVADCVDGRDSADRTVRICNLCAMALTSRGGNLQIERSEFNIPFRRAVSHEQPDIAPLDGNGVWVASFVENPMSHAEISRSRTYMSRELTSEDLQPLGMRRQSGFESTVCLPPNPGMALGLCVLTGSRGVMDALSTDHARDIMQGIVGRCP